MLYGDYRPVDAIRQNDKSSANQLLWHAGKASADDGQDSAEDDESPIQGLFSWSNVLSKQLQVESNRQDDANGETSNTAEQCHNAIERWEEDGDDDEDDDSYDFQGNLEQTSAET